MKEDRSMRIIVLTVGLLTLVGSAGAADQPVATVAGHPITRAELDKSVKAKLVEIDNERYEALRDGLDELVTAELYKLEAKARNTTPEKLQQELTAKIPEPTDA